MIKGFNLLSVNHVDHGRTEDKSETLRYNAASVSLLTGIHLVYWQ